MRLKAVQTPTDTEHIFRLHYEFCTVASKNSALLSPLELV